MIYNERDIRNRTVLALAEAVMTAARTAPKAKGRDLVEAVLITEDDLQRLADTMREMSAESGMKFLLRDANNVLEAGLRAGGRSAARFESDVLGRLGGEADERFGRCRSGVRHSARRGVEKSLLRPQVAREEGGKTRRGGFEIENIKK